MTAGLLNLSAVEASDLIASKELSSQELVSALIERAISREPGISAWAHLDHDRAINEARARDAEPRRGPLHGIPVGIKDLFDAVAMPATYGSAIYANHYPPADASCVAMLKNAGAIILGKTACVEFAASQPTKTRNPLNVTHTPGGSSSGSAAVVADRHVPLALGTQTGGSVIRPAAFCGIIGFKPTYGRFCLAGCKMCAWSLDTLGFFARSVADCNLIYTVLSGCTESRTQLRPALFKIGAFVDPGQDQADSFAREAIDKAAAALRTAGYPVTRVTAPDEFARLRKAQRIIARFEMARSLAYEWNSKRHLLSKKIVEELKEGWAYSETQYSQAQADAREARAVLPQMFSAADILLTIATTGEAPYGLETTGSAFFNSPWTLLGTPAICLPFGSGPSGLPTAIQLIGLPDRDEILLDAACGIELVLNRSDEYPRSAVNL